ncbi:MAG: hypothetical protein B6U76_02320 [Desulfurococcales archaeon ex4484_217_2]|nr:MAG: hypothetical protein B6U76_02320 [Desulfurococcales archaeon ex4484_217_2]
MFDIAFILIFAGFVIWLSLVAYTLFKPKLKFRREIGGGAPIYEEAWSRGVKEPLEREALRDYDLKLLVKLSRSGGEAAIDEILAALDESSPAIAERIHRLEAKGFIVRSPSGSFVLTEEGRKYAESLKEKLWYRRREREILEGR